MYDEIISQVSLFDLIGTNDDFVLYRAEEIKGDSEKKDSRNLVSRRFLFFFFFCLFRSSRTQQLFTILPARSSTKVYMCLSGSRRRSSRRLIQF